MVGRENGLRKKILDSHFLYTTIKTFLVPNTNASTIMLIKGL